MRFLSDFIAKKVLNISSGQVEGTIKNACFDTNFKKIENFKMFDEDDEEYLLNVKKICAVGQDAVVIRNKEAMVLAINEAECHDFSTMNMQVYSADGKNLGKVGDIEFSDNYKLTSLVVGENNIPLENIISLGKVIVTKGENFSKMLSKTRSNPFKATTTSNHKVTILAPQIENDTKSPSTPVRAVASPNFLLGRKATKTIYGMNNEVIIKKESAITSSILESAKRHGKLVELTIFSHTT